VSENPLNARKEYINNVSKGKIVCPACKEKVNKNIKIKLGVSERIDVISTSDEPIHPNHRPSYINAVPLIDIIRAVKKIKSTNSVTVLKSYGKMINELGTEFDILIDKEIEQIKKFDKEIATVIEAIRNNNVEYTPGGGGTYGQIQLEI